MAHRLAKFVSAMSAGLVVGAPFATIPQQAVHAAEECLTKPRDVTPAGKHWYYRVVRGTNRHCWYLHEETETSSHASISRRARRAAIVASRKSEPALSQTTVDAYAEFGLPQGRDENAPQVSQQTLITSDYPKGARQDPPDTVSGESPQSPVAARWPEPAGVRSAANEPTTPSSLAVASATPDAEQDASTADVTPKAPAVALMSAATPATEMPASLEPLLAATFGAIALTGFAGSSVYLLARMRRRPQSHASLSRESGRPPAEWVDRSLPPPWLYLAHDAEGSDRRTGGADGNPREMG